MTPEKKDVPHIRWEIYNPETGKRIGDSPYVSGGPFSTRKQALAVRDRFSHRFGYSLGVRRVEEN